MTISSSIATTGGPSSGAVTGGKGGNITLTAASGTVTVSNTLTADGNIGGSAGGTGGASGAITISSQTVSTGSAIYARGGAGLGSGGGGAGGAVSLTATSTYISMGNVITTTGGVGAGGTNSAGFGNGGAGGAITMTAATYLNIPNAINSSGGAGAGGGNGGNGGAITGTATSSYVNVANIITTDGGNSGSGIANQSGGNGGAITFSAGDYFALSVALSGIGGSSRGTGTSTAANVSFTGTNGVAISNSINLSATTTYGTLTINDGNSTVGGNNTGYTLGTLTLGALTKTGTGNFALVSPNGSWSGATTITAGTITTGAANVIPDASQLVFNGGKLHMGNYSETVSTIKISDYSVLDLPVGNFTLTASASNGITWTNNKKLGINNWLGGYDGTGGGGSDPKFKMGTTNDLNASHLAALYFRRTSNGSTYTATQITGTGEIVPTGTLPVKLVSFTANKNNEEVVLQWETAAEINSDYFEILRGGSDMQWALAS